MKSQGIRLLVPLLALAMSLSGCTPTTPEPGEAAAAKRLGEPAAAGPERLELVFFDSRAFDDDLSSAFSTNADRIEVKAASPFDLNDIPDRLESWLAAVQESGGEVRATQIPRPGEESRGIVTEIISLIMMAVGSAREEALYASATAYDAWLRYRPDGVVEDTVFVRRGSPAADGSS